MPEIKHTPSDDEALEQLTYPEFDEIEFHHGVLKEGLPGALELLPERLRMVFLAHTVGEESYASIAARLGESEASVRKQYSRARQMLEGLLGATNN